MWWDFLIQFLLHVFKSKIFCLHLFFNANWFSPISFIYHIFLIYYTKPKLFLIFLNDVVFALNMHTYCIVLIISFLQTSLLLIFLSYLCYTLTRRLILVYSCHICDLKMSWIAEMCHIVDV